MKTLLFHITKLPYGSLEQEENIEMILFAASFGCSVAVVFTGLGIWQLMPAETASPIQKSLAKMIASFPSFEIEHIYASEEDVRRLGLNSSEFSVNLQLISMKEILQLKQQYDVIIEM